MSAKKRGLLSYPSYNFINKDPALDAARTVIEDSGLSFSEIHQNGGATVTTQKAWFHGNRKRCRFDAIMATVRAAGGDIIFTSPKGQQIKVTVNRKK